MHSPQCRFLWRTIRCGTIRVCEGHYSLEERHHRLPRDYEPTDYSRQLNDSISHHTATDHWDDFHTEVQYRLA